MTTLGATPSTTTYPAFTSDTAANKPAAASGNLGCSYYETDTGRAFISTGSAWVQIGINPTVLAPAVATLAADVAITNANQWYDGPSVSLVAGTWLIEATISGGNSSINAVQIGKLYNSTDTVDYVSSHMFQNVVASAFFGSCSLSYRVTLSATKTIKAAMRANGTGATMYKFDVLTNNIFCTYLTATPVA